MQPDLRKTKVLKRLKIKEVIEIVADSGLRLVKLSLGEEFITDTAHYIHQKYPDHDLEEIKKVGCQRCPPDAGVVVWDAYIRPSDTPRNQFLYFSCG